MADGRKNLQQLLSSARLWRAGERRTLTAERIPTGFPELDDLLGGGWLRGGLTQCWLQQPGAAELRLFLPACGELLTTCPESRLFWINPPHIPYAPALQAAGLDLARLVVLTPTAGDELWALEQVLRSSHCAACLFWGGAPAADAQRRLQLATEVGGSWGALVHGGAPVRQMSAWSAQQLRLHLKPAELLVEVVRQRGGVPGSVRLEGAA